MTVEELLSKLQNTDGDVNIITSEGAIEDIVGHFNNNGIVDIIELIIK